MSSPSERPRELHEKSESLKKHLSELEAVMQQHSLADVEFDLIRQSLSVMGDNIDDYSIEQKRAAIRTFIRKIVWDGENAHLYLFGSDGDYVFPQPSIAETISDEIDKPSGEDSK